MKELDYRILEANTAFEQSLIWQINRSYYEEVGLSAWSDGVVPHNMTSNMYVGNTYAGVILGFLKDIALIRQNDEVVYIVELGSGHGRLAFHILRLLDKMIALEAIKLPSYCYVLTDIVDSNLTFFEEHPQLQEYFESGKLDVAYYDGVASKEIILRNQNKTIHQNSLINPMIAIANYFFDSIPNQLFKIKNKQIFSCEIMLETPQKKEYESNEALLKNLRTSILVDDIEHINKKDPFIKDLLDDYKAELNETHLLIPRLAINCIETLKGYSEHGLMLISIDKGYSDIAQLEGRPEPEIIHHGSFSVYVNFHALEKYCAFQDGKTFFSSFSDYSMQLGCFLFTKSPDSYSKTIAAYDHYIDDFGPDDYNGMKKMAYRLVSYLTLRELITIMRLGNFDSTLFLKLLPFIRKLLSPINKTDRSRLKQTLSKIHHFYFDIKEPLNASFEIAGILYDIAYYKESLEVYDSLTDFSGDRADIYYNKILCYYQLRMDKAFSATLIKAKAAYPGFEKFAHLEKLDLNAV